MADEMKILLATDGSEYARAAGELLARIPFPDSTTVTVMTVTNEHGPLDFEDHLDSESEAATYEKWKQEHADSADRMLDKQASLLRDGTAWNVKTLCRHGVAADEIVDAATETDADLIVIGSHGMGVIGRFLLGSVSRKVAEYAPCSVLVVRQSDEVDVVPGLQLVLGHDTSAPADAAVRMLGSIDWADNAELTVVHVMEISRFFRMDILEEMTDAWQKQKREAKRGLESAVQQLGNSFTTIHSRLREGANTADELIGAADEVNADIIIVGNTGKSAVTRFFMGSVSSGVLNHANSSALVVRNK